MARISLSEVIQNIAGSVGEHTFGCWKGVNYLRQKAVTISNPCSLAQSSVRAALSALARMWHAELTAAQRSLWNEYAQGLKSAGEQVGPNGNGGAGILQVIPGNGGVMSGFNSFVMVNITALVAGSVFASPPVPNAPLGVVPPNPPTGLTGVYNPGVPSFELEWDGPVDATDEIVRVWSFCFQAGVHKQQLSFHDWDEAPPIGLVPWRFRIAQGKSLPYFPPGHYFFQVDAVRGGLKSPPSNVFSLII